MNRLRQILKDRRGVAFPLIIAIVLVLVMLMCCISEYFRLLIVAQGVRDAVQEAVISTVNDNYDDVYHGVREGYSGAYQPMAGDFEESLDYGDIYGRLDALKAGVIYDLKFSKSYEAGKYLDSPQHPIYLDCVPEAVRFVYVISDGKAVYTEEYRREEVTSPDRVICEFMAYLEQSDLAQTYIDYWKTN